MTKLCLNTNRNEGLNRSLSASLSKNVNFLRNVTGMACAATDRLNCGNGVGLHLVVCPRVAALNIHIVYLCQEGSREQVISDLDWDSGCSRYSCSSIEVGRMCGKGGNRPRDHRRRVTPVQP